MKKQPFLELYKTVESSIELNERKLRRAYSKMLYDFITHYADSNICTARKSFSDKQMNEIINYTGNNSKYYANYIKEYSVNPNWRNINDPNNLVLMLLIKYNVVNKMDKYGELLTVLLMYKMLSGVLLKFFPTGCSEGIMSYTLSSFSNKYLLGKNSGDLTKTITEMAKSHFHTYKNNLKKNDDKLLFDYLIYARNRINSFVKNIATNYYSNKEKELVIKSNEVITVDEDSNKTISFSSDNGEVLNIKATTEEFINQTGYNDKLVSEIKSTFLLSTKVSREIYEKILRDENNFSYLFSAIVESLNGKLKRDNMCSKTFFKEIFTFLKSKYNSNKLKPALEELLVKEFPKYPTMAASSRARYKNAVITMYLFYLLKANCDKK